MMVTRIIDGTHDILDFYKGVELARIIQQAEDEGHDNSE
jgi:hypothetical protein